MKKTAAFGLALLAAFLFSPGVQAQDFGFGFGEESGEAEAFLTPAAASPVKISGEVSAEFSFFFDELGSAEKIQNIEAGNIFRGNLNFYFHASKGGAFINLELVPVFDGSSPVNLGEAYGSAYLGPLTLEAGLRKLSWGRADSFGPLDVINPLDYSDLSLLSDPLSMKIPRPMLHAVFAAGSFSKLEAAFVPWFRGHRFALSGPWAPSRISGLAASIASGLERGFAQSTPPPLMEQVSAELENWRNTFDINDYYKEYIYTLNSAQAGIRFTTTFGASDIGFQYYFGRLPDPAYSINIDAFKASLAGGSGVDTSLIDISTDYNFYHQIGFDFARVISGFNARAEFGANITEDLDGKNEAVYNPALVYSLGFDRDLFLGINLNLQGNGSVTLFHDKIKNGGFDVESGTDVSSTRITGILSKKFLRDEIEIKAAALWGIEDRDFMIRPSAEWTKDSLGAELSAGFFGGGKKGELGQYADNNYIRFVLSFYF